MPKFYFHLIAQNSRHEDLVGSDFIDAEAARDRAERLARNIRIQEILPDHIPDGRRIEVTSPGKGKVAVVHFHDILSG
jgi:hypothetical protein